MSADAELVRVALEPDRSLADFVKLIDDPHREPCQQMLTDFAERWGQAPGSRAKHQAWRGGYVDHIRETMQIAADLHATLSARVELPFTVADALLVIFLHDLEKGVKYRIADDGTVALSGEIGSSKDAGRDYREALLVKYGITLTPEQRNAFDNIEGEKDAYNPYQRIMNELAGFCNACDTISARVLHSGSEA